MNDYFTTNMALLRAFKANEEAILQGSKLLLQNEETGNLVVMFLHNKTNTIVIFGIDIVTPQSVPVIFLNTPNTPVRYRRRGVFSKQQVDLFQKKMAQLRRKHLTTLLNKMEASNGTN
jgi:hypothetical protein